MSPEVDKAPVSKAQLRIFFQLRLFWIISILILCLSDNH
jgi:hypothetical protein